MAGSSEVKELSFASSDFGVAVVVGVSGDSS